MGFLGDETASGISMDPEKALACAPAFAASKIISETLASLPLGLFEHLPDGGSRPAIEKPVHNLLRFAPNPEMSAMELREAGQTDLLLWGNEYCQIVRDNAGRIREIWPLSASRMQVERKSGELVYTYNHLDGRQTKLPAREVLHIRDLCRDGVVGLSRVQQTAEALGLSLAAEKFSAAFYKNGAKFSGIAEYPGKMSEEAWDRFKKSFNADLHGGGQAAQVCFFWRTGLKFHETSMPLKDAQFLESRKFQISEIARIFRVPPHKIGDLEKATFSNIESQSTEFVVDCVLPWCVRREQKMAQALLKPELRGRFYFKHNIQGLLRGDTKNRSEYYTAGRQWGWLSANDVRALEDQNPIGPAGDIYLAPVNMVPADQLGQDPDPDPAPDGGDDRARKIIRAAAERVVMKEVKAAKRAWQTHRDERQAWAAWVDQFYSRHENFAAEVLALDPGPELNKYLDESRAELRSAPDVERLLARWESDKPALLAGIAGG